MYCYGQYLAPMDRMQQIEQELNGLKSQLADAYKQLSDQYRRMQKMSDDLRLDAMQGSADKLHAQVAAIRVNLRAKLADYMAEWDTMRGKNNHKQPFVAPEPPL